MGTYELCYLLARNVPKPTNIHNMDVQFYGYEKLHCSVLSHHTAYIGNFMRADVAMLNFSS